MTPKVRTNSVAWRASRWMIVMLACFVGIAYAKNIDYTPDITSSAYWDSHHVAVVHVLAIGNRGEEDGTPESITYQVEVRLSDGDIEAIRTVPFSHLWFGISEGKPNRIEVGDRLVIYYTRQGHSPIVVTRLNERREGSAFLESLRHIAQLRNHGGGPQAYLEAALAEDPTVARYSLRYLLDLTTTPQTDHEYITKLRRARNEDGRDSTDQILAVRLAFRLDGAGDTPDAEYTWLKTSLGNSREKDWNGLKPFVDRLLDFAEKRSDTVAFLTQMATSTTVPLPNRIAAYGAFADPRLFRFDAPDADSRSIFQACLRLLADPNPLLRRAGAALVYNITMAVDPADQPTYKVQSTNALTAALASETDEIAKFHLNSFLELLSI